MPLRDTQARPLRVEQPVVLLQLLAVTTPLDYLQDVWYVYHMSTCLLRIFRLMKNVNLRCTVQFKDCVAELTRMPT